MAMEIYLSTCEGIEEGDRFVELVRDGQEPLSVSTNQLLPLPLRDGLSAFFDPNTARLVGFNLSDCQGSDGITALKFRLDRTDHLCDITEINEFRLGLKRDYGYYR